GAGMMAAGVTSGATLLAPIRDYSESENAANQLAGSMMGPGVKVAPEFLMLNMLSIALGDRLPDFPLWFYSHGLPLFSVFIS
ncbi:hypothetical protein Q6247_26915, partial [Klebsiella pneumoniae]